MPYISNLRRVSRPYPLRLAVKCRRIKSQFRREGFIAGESLNISSKDLLITTTETLLPGQAIEAFIDWPILLDNHVRLTLVVEGVVVRTSEKHAAMRIKKYHFRTRGGAELRTDTELRTGTQARVMTTGASV